MIRKPFEQWLFEEVEIAFNIERVKNVIEIKEVLLWRNKIAAHFAITDPRKDDNIATLEASLFYPAIFDNERYRTGAMIFSRGQENISVESNIPYWSPTEVFELVAKRFMPDVNFNN